MLNDDEVLKLLVESLWVHVSVVHVVVGVASVSDAMPTTSPISPAVNGAPGTAFSVEKSSAAWAEPPATATAKMAATAHVLSLISVSPQVSYR